MLLTLKVLITPDSTEGVEKDQKTALKNNPAPENPSAKKENVTEENEDHLQA